MSQHIAKYGAWQSPITEASLVEGRVGFESPITDGDDLYWIESRPLEGGRYTLMKRKPDGTTVDLLPKAYNARTTVHEYGGGSFWVQSGYVYFSNFTDQCIWRVSEGHEPVAITAPGKHRYGDFRLDTRHMRLICVRESHGQTQVTNEIVAVPCNGGPVTVLAQGADFYAYPRLNHDGTRLAWLCWNHPNMPWNDVELWVGDLDAQGNLLEQQCIIGGRPESLCQPEWTADGRLVFISDRSGWWNLHVWDGNEVLPMHTIAAEFARPLWQLGQSSFGFAGNRTITLYSQEGSWKLAGLDTKTGALVDYSLPFSRLCDLWVSGERAFLIGSSSTQPSVMICVNLLSGSYEVLRHSTQIQPDPRYTSIGEAFSFPTSNRQVAYGFYFPPANQDYAAPAGTLPPLLTMVHGGPTSATSSSYSLAVQYWTSRGFAVFDVNHRGSSGYGRAFRDQLEGQWGIVDVEDAAHGALYLAEQGKANSDQLIIRGGSAGGYTTLAALAFQNVFSAGASYYGVGDIELLAQDTHKFESRYMDRLIGPYPERADLYRARSPIHHLDRLDKPVLLLQGLEDKVVPPAQSERILEALKARGVPVAYVPFAGEQHGFRKAENIIRAYQAEWYFYARVFDFAPSTSEVELQIFNLP